MRRLSMLIAIVLLGCGGASLSPAALCSERAGAWECAPGAVCVTTRNGWIECVCCTLPPDAGYAITLQNTAADCEQQKRDWATLCPPP